MKKLDYCIGKSAELIPIAFVLAVGSVARTDCRDQMTEGAAYCLLMFVQLPPTIYNRRYKLVCRTFTHTEWNLHTVII